MAVQRIGILASGGNGSLAGAHRRADPDELAGQPLAIAGSRPRSTTTSG